MAFEIDVTDDSLDIGYTLLACRIATKHPDSNRKKAAGAIVVNRGQIIGFGSRHTQYNVVGYKLKCVHAEDVALRDASDLAIGATLYVTLEPCLKRAVHRSWYPMPTCCDLILMAKINRVVVGFMDEDFGGGGATLLAKMGVRVSICSAVNDFAAKLVDDSVVPPESRADYEEFLRSQRKESK